MPPNDLHAVFDDATRSVELTWSPVEGADSYMVYRNGQALGTATTASFLDPAPLISSTYTVTAWMSSTESGPSVPASVATPPRSSVWYALPIGPGYTYDAVVVDAHMCDLIGIGGMPPSLGINWGCWPIPPFDEGP